MLLLTVGKCVVMDAVADNTNNKEATENMAPVKTCFACGCESTYRQTRNSIFQGIHHGHHGMTRPQVVDAGTPSSYGAWLQIQSVRMKEKTVIGRSYLDVLELYALPQLPPQTILQQDGAPPHF
ncbi:uncharacterized protein LOC110828629 [Zootermopsis nevadensis]|uniref:uncharacterized protein LOC110828629 n=1 Tax=Zootermopsis nevadensis TaxID=136037 RepID=UPI000B8EA432|nr:uncharacterized protein LOC110828629 [Zootermopsis nevadensis]